MSKTNVLVLVGDLSLNLAEQAECDRLYDEIVTQLGMDERNWVTNRTTTVVAPGIATVALAETIIHILGVEADGQFLSRETQRTLQLGNLDWRVRFGPFSGYVVEGEDERTLRLTPAASVGATISVLHTERRTDMPAYLDLPLALLVLGREFERESNHRDAGFSAICEATGKYLLDYIV